MEKVLFLGECKWDRHPIDLGVLTKLVGKTEKVVPKDGHWRVYYLGFARCGWRQEAQAFTESLPKTKIKGENWHAVGMMLKDLEQIDNDLHEWTV
jgi:hypothetical protein